MSKLIFTTALILLLCSACFNTLAVANEETVSAKTKFKIGVSFINHFPHFDFNAEEDKGLSWAILEAFAKQYHYEFEYVILPPVRLQSALNNGDIDFIFPDNPTWTAYRSDKDVNIFSAPFVETVSTSYVSHLNQYLPLSEVESVSIPYGYTATSWMEPIKRYNIESIPATNLTAAMQAVKAGVATAADVPYNIGQHLLKTNPSLGVLVVNKNLPHTRANYHLSTKKHVLLLEQIGQFKQERAEIIQMLRDTYGVKTYEEVFHH